MEWNFLARLAGDYYMFDYNPNKDDSVDELNFKEQYVEDVDRSSSGPYALDPTQVYICSDMLFKELIVFS